MSDFDFDKAFAKDLDKERAFEPAKGRWDKMAGCLDQISTRERHRRMLMLWLLPALLLGAFSLLGTALYRNTARVDAMQAQITQLQSALSAKSVAWSDTVHRHIAVIHYDTIYRTVVVNRIVQNRVGELAGQNTPALQNNQPFKEPENRAASLDPSIPATASETIDKENPLPGEKDNSITNSPDANNPSVINAETSLASETVRQKKAFTTLPVLPQQDLRTIERRQKDQVPDLGLMMPPPLRESQGEKLIRRFRPQDFALGLTGGLIYPQVAHLQQFSVWSIGLNAEMALGRQLRLRTGTDYVPTRFQVEPFGQHDWNIPQLNPPTPEDNLRFITINQPLWDFSLGLRYILRPEKRFHPYGSAAWLGELTLGQSLQYEYNNPLTESNTYIRMHRNESRFNAGGLQLGLGAEYVLGKRVLFQLESLYQRQVSRSPRMSGRWSLKAGLLYRF